LTGSVAVGQWRERADALATANRSRLRPTQWVEVCRIESHNESADVIPQQKE
jgi:hypothetical protein